MEENEGQSRPKIFTVTCNNEYRGSFSGPGETANAVQQIKGVRWRSKSNITPQLAKLRIGETFTCDGPNAGDVVRVSRVKTVMDEETLPPPDEMPRKPEEE